MAERYPEDAALLAMDQDEATGVQYIATGQSPYYLQFRRMLQRLLLATRRANDLRVHQDGDMTVGVRGGRCVLNNTAIEFPPVAGMGVPDNAIRYLWLDASGSLQSGDAMPASRTAMLPLARVITGAGAIAEIEDLRGETMLAVPSLSLLGVTATAGEINQVLAGLDPSVTAAALAELAGGPESTADTRHRHLQVATDSASETEFRLINRGSDPAANISLKFDLPNRLAEVTALVPDSVTGWLRQRRAAISYSLVGALHAGFIHEGPLTASLADKLIGVVPVDGTVSTVILTLGTNINSSVSSDGITATVKVNGAALADTDPNITQAAGAGFRSTAQGDGAAAVIKSDGVQNVRRGDLLTVDLNRAAAGTIAADAAHVVVMVVIRAGNPE